MYDPQRKKFTQIDLSPLSASVQILTTTSNLIIKSSDSLYTVDTAMGSIHAIQQFSDYIKNISLFRGGSIFTTNSSVGKLWVLNDALQLYEITSHPDMLPLPNSFEKYAILENKIYFIAEHTSNGLQLWKSDGTEEGTVPITSITATAFNDLLHPCALRNQLIMGEAISEDSLRIVRIDTSGNKTMLKELTDGDELTFYGSIVNSKLAFISVSTYLDEEGTDTIFLWRTDGTPEGTFVLDQLEDDGGLIYGLSGNYIIYGAGNSTDETLHYSDGIMQSPIPIITELSSLRLDEAESFGGRLFFRHHAKNIQGELHYFSMIPTVFQDIYEGPGSSMNSYDMITMGDELFLIADDGLNGGELYSVSCKCEDQIKIDYNNIEEGSYHSASSLLLNGGTKYGESYQFYSGSTIEISSNFAIHATSNVEMNLKTCSPSN